MIFFLFGEKEDGHGAERSALDKEIDVDSLQVTQVSTARRLLSKFKYWLSGRSGFDGPPSIVQSEFDSLVAYRSALVHRSEYLKHALEESIAEVDKEIKEVNNLVGREMLEFAKTSLKGQRKKQIPTPSGVVQMRRLPSKLVVVDAAKQKAWASKMLPAAVRRRALLKSLSAIQVEVVMDLVLDRILSSDQVEIVESVDLVATRKHFKETGEIPDGMSLEEGQHRLYLREDQGGVVVGSPEVAADLLAAQTEEAIADASLEDSSGNGAGDGGGDNASVPTPQEDAIAALEGR